MNENEKNSPASSDGFDWSKIRLEYVTKKITYRELCEKYGCSMSVLSKRASAEKWSEERKKQRKRVETKTKEKVADREAEKNAKKLITCRDLADELLVKLSQAIDELNIHLLKLSEQETYEAERADGSTVEIVKRREKLKKAKSIIKTDDIKKLSAALKDINEILSEGEGGDSNRITVVLEGALNEYGA